MRRSSTCLRAADFAPLRPPLAFIRSGVEAEITLIDRAHDGAIVTLGFEDWSRDAGTFGDEFRVLNGHPVRVVSVAGLLAVKTRRGAHFGEPPRPQDLADAQLLQQLQASN